jgi:hypothetical protein
LLLNETTLTFRVRPYVSVNGKTAGEWQYLESATEAGAYAFKDGKAPNYTGTLSASQSDGVWSLDNTSGGDPTVRTVGVYLGSAGVLENNSLANMQVTLGTGGTFTSTLGEVEFLRTEGTYAYFKVTVGAGANASGYKTFRIKVKDSSGNQGRNIDVQLYQ